MGDGHGAERRMFPPCSTRRGQQARARGCLNSLSVTVVIMDLQSVQKRNRIPVIPSRQSDLGARRLALSSEAETLQMNLSIQNGCGPNQLRALCGRQHGRERMECKAPWGRSVVSNHEPKVWTPP